MLEGIDPAQIKDDQIRGILIELLNLVEAQASQIRAQAAEIQRLRDENSRLKGEQGQPHINPHARPGPAPLSSEAERREAKPRQPRAKQAHLVITREELCTLDRTLLPADAEFKGYEDVIVQDLRVECDTIRFRKEKFYSPSAGQTFLAPLPPGYHGQFGPDLRSFLLSQYFAANVSEPKLAQLLSFFGVQISNGQISNLLTRDVADFAAESSAVLAAGLGSSFYQQIDATSTRVDGQNWACQILTNPCYTAYRTTPGQDRLQVLGALTDQEELGYLLNAPVLAYLEKQGLAAKWLRQLQSWAQGSVLRAAEMTERLAAWGRVPVTQAKLVREGLALGAYHAQTRWPPPRVLIGDDAPVWRELGGELGLCWVHEVRHYKKLCPGVAYLATIQQRFLRRVWRYYGQLKEYQAHPTAARVMPLRQAFQRLFNTVTPYVALNEVIARTRAKQGGLLLVLKYPQIPLHNNAAELGARRRVRKRDVSFGPRSAAGLKAWDTFMTLGATTQKLGVNFYAYVRDRLRHGGAIPPLAELIQHKAAALQLTPA